MIFLSELG